MSFDSLDIFESFDLFGFLGEFFGSLAARYLSRIMDLSTRGMSERRHFSRLSRWRSRFRRSHQSSIVGFPMGNRSVVMGDIGARPVDSCPRSPEGMLEILNEQIKPEGLSSLCSNLDVILSRVGLRRY